MLCLRSGPPCRSCWRRPVPGVHDVDVAGRDRARRLAQAVEIDGLRCSWNSRRAGRGGAVSAEVDAERAAEGGGGTGVVAGAVGIGRRREAAFVDAAGGRAGEHRHVVDDRDLEVARQRDAVAVEVDRLDQAGQVEVEIVLAGDRLVERLVEHERVGAVRRRGRQRHREHDARVVNGRRRGGARIADQRIGIEQHIVDEIAVRRERNGLAVVGDRYVVRGRDQIAEGDRIAAGDDALRPDH